VLARAPAPERLLEPLARVALVDETSFDMLTRPLDVSAVLARVLDATSAADPTAPDVAASRRSGRATPREGSDDSNRLPLRPVMAGGRAADIAPPLAGDQRPRSEDVSRRPPRSAWPGAADTSAQPSADPVAAAVTAARPPLSATVVANDRWPRWRPSLGTEARVGAATRVVLGAPDQDLERLLATGAPAATAAATPTARAGSARPSSRHAEPDAARLLGRALERVGDRVRRASPAPALADLRSRGRARTSDPIEAASSGHETDAPVAEAAASPVGFRGLALRALGTSDPTPHIPVPLETEPRPATQVRLDDLDARVAESLARILEREARRHGIDVAGTRA
jgi:hypothetical protein